MGSILSDLPIDQRLDALEALWDSIAGDQGALPVTDGHRAELDRRLEAYTADGERGAPAGDVLARLRARLTAS